MREWVSWYSADVKKLMDYYSDRANDGTPSGRFWQKIERDERAEKIHVPLAADIVSVSADFLFSEPPRVEVAEAHLENAPQDAIDTEDRLNELVRDNRTFSTLVEGAESAAALGGTFLKVNWDKELRDFPILSVAQADSAIPTFKWGFLQGVTFFHRVLQNGSEVYRKLERHSPGQIQYRLYRGTEQYLGSEVPLDTLSETEGFERDIDTGIDDILVRYVPNKLPNRLWRDKPLGNSDFQGLEGMMDSLDEVYSAWVREIRMGKAQKIVPESWLEMDEANAPFYDLDRMTFTALSIPPDEMQKAEVVQPEMRHEAYAETCLHLVERITTLAGYSPQSFGLNIKGRAESGTALRQREKKSQNTAEAKKRYWREPLEEILKLLLAVDAKHFDSGVNPDYTVEVDFAEYVKDDPVERADSIAKLKEAQAMSTQERVRYMHPDWDTQQVEEEAERIREEN